MAMFFLTTVPNGDDGTATPRCVGYFTTLEECERVLCTDLGDLSEDSYYRYAVVEEYEPGLYPTGRNQSWWVFIHRDTGWEKCDRPARYAHTCNFGIG